MHSFTLTPDSPRSSQDSQAFRALEHLSLQSLQLQPLLQLQLLRRHRRPRSRCSHYLDLPVAHSSHHCQRLHSSRTLLRQSSQSPSPLYHRHYLQGEEERVLCFSSRHSRQPQHLLQMLTHLLLSRLPLLRTLSQAALAREPPGQLHPQSVQTSSSRPSLRARRPTTTTTTTRTASSPCHDSRISSSPFWCFDAKLGESQGS